MSCNPTYKTIDVKLRIAGFTIGQWAQLLGSVLVAIAFGARVSPFAAGPTFTLSVLIAGLPVAVSYGLNGSEFSAIQLVRGVWRWQTRPRRYVSGPGTGETGYVVVPPEPGEAFGGLGVDDELPMEAAWDA